MKCEACDGQVTYVIVFGFTRLPDVTDEHFLCASCAWQWITVNGHSPDLLYATDLHEVR